MEWVRNCKGRFNSMIVRLKGDVDTWEIKPQHMFQFYDSPIKSVIWYLAYAILFCCFNSMIVRLKDKYQGKFPDTFLFQFYDSPIKRHYITTETRCI